MGSSVSYEYYNKQFSSSQSGITSEGGFYQTFINNTGLSSVKGTIVIASSLITNGVSIAPSSSQMPIGVIYEDNIAIGQPVKVVTYGRAQVLLKNLEIATLGSWCGVSDVPGRMYQQLLSPSTSEHSREIGHSLQASLGGSNVLSFVQLHFN